MARHVCLSFCGLLYPVCDFGKRTSWHTGWMGLALKSIGFLVFTFVQVSSTVLGIVHYSIRRGLDICIIFGVQNISKCTRLSGISLFAESQERLLGDNSRVSTAYLFPDNCNSNNRYGSAVNCLLSWWSRLARYIKHHHQAVVLGRETWTSLADLSEWS